MTVGHEWMDSLESIRQKLQVVVGRQIRFCGNAFMILTLVKKEKLLRHLFQQAFRFFFLSIDPLGQLKVPAGSDHYFRTHLRPYVCVRLHFSKCHKTNKGRLNIMIATGGTVGLAEGIIDDTCLVLSIFLLKLFCFGKWKLGKTKIVMGRKRKIRSSFLILQHRKWKNSYINRLQDYPSSSFEW